MKKIILSIFLLTVTLGHGQELNLPVWTQYLADNNFVISPTYAGIGDNIRVRANGLTQWVGIKDAPDNQSVYVDGRIADRSGLGLNLYNDKNGFTRQTGAKFSFAQHLILDYYSEQYLSLGISFNLNNFKIDIDEFNTTYENPRPDPGVTDNRFTSNKNFDIGALYRNGGYYLSFNASNILPKDIKKFSVKEEPDLLTNFQIFSGYVFRSNQYHRVEYEPSVYYQYFVSDRRSSTDVNFKFRKYNKYEDYYWAGISYRFLNDQFFKPLNLGPMAGIKKGGFYFGYSYQVTINDLARFNTGTHAITIGLDIFAGISNCPCTQSPVHD